MFEGKVINDDTSLEQDSTELHMSTEELDAKMKSIIDDAINTLASENENDALIRSAAEKIVNFLKKSENVENSYKAIVDHIHNQEGGYYSTDQLPAVAEILNKLQNWKDKRSKIS